MFKLFQRKHPILFRAAAAVTGFAVLVLCFYLYIAYFLPLPDLFAVTPDVPTTKIFDRNGILLYEILKPESGKKTLIPLNQISRQFVNATLAAEDINFYSHPGVDLFAVTRAIFFNIKEQRVVSGGSTITQQLVRNIIGSKPERDLADKILEAFYAIRISHLYSKDQILELYLNKIYYGNMAYGAQSAALDFFGKNIHDLDLAQSAFLTGLPQSPSNYNPYVHYERAKKRQRYVLDQMVKNNFISADDADAAYSEPLILRSNKYKIKAPHFVHFVIGRLEQQFGEDMMTRGGLQVKTTLDYNLQLKAERIIEKQVELLKRNSVTNGALVALDVPTAQILAWVGSADYFNEKISGSVDMVTALRQPGSSIKPLNYLLAFEKGYTPATVLFDIPTQFQTETGPYAPKNYDLAYHGPVRVRTALASSYNIPAVKTLEFAGVENFIFFLRKLGIETLEQSPSHYGLALTLGGGEVRPIDMANAFNVIANYGVKRPESALLEVKNSTGDVLYRWSLPEGEYVLGPQGKQHAWQIIDILKDPLARIPGFGEGSVLEISREAAVKTGTTRNFRDNWTIGFTPELLTAVWVGNADASPMENVSGVDGAAPIWADFMESALELKPESSFEKSSNLINAEICALSGKLPTEYCRERVSEFFVKGTEPREKDDYYRPFWVHGASGRIIPETCRNLYPEASLQQKVLVVYPPELQKWAAQNGLQLPPIEQCHESSGYTSGYADDYSFDKAGAVSIDNPANNDEYLLDSSIPLKDQKIPFRVTVPVETIEVKFYVDDVLAGSQIAHPFTFLWLPSAGRHDLRIEAIFTDGTAHEASASFVVK